MATRTTRRAKTLRAVGANSAFVIYRYEDGRCIQAVVFHYFHFHDGSPVTGYIDLDN